MGTLGAARAGVLLLLTGLIGCASEPIHYDRNEFYYQVRTDLRSGASFRDCRFCPEMVVIPEGEFLRPPRSEGEAPQRVRVQQFAAGRMEVTIDEWAMCVMSRGCTPSRPPGYELGRGRLSARGMSWDQAQEYARWLSEETGQRYRLLTADEWQYVAGAGERTPRRSGPMVRGAGRFYEWVEDCNLVEGVCSWRYLYKLDSDGAGWFSHPSGFGELDFEFRVARDYPRAER